MSLQVATIFCETKMELEKLKQVQRSMLKYVGEIAACYPKIFS